MPYHTIGQPGSPAVELFRKHGLAPLQKLLSPELFAGAWSGAAHPRAILLPPVVFWLMAAAALSDGSMRGAVFSFWTSLHTAFPALCMKSITEESFCMARKALPLDFFRALFDGFVRLQEKTHANRWLWHGKRVLALDGLLLSLAPAAALRASHPPPRNRKGTSKHPQALLVGLVGVWSGLCHAFMLVPQAQSEQWCARWLMRHLCPGDLLLADRNFSSYELIARVLRRSADCLFRLPANRFHKLPRRPTNSGRGDEWLVDLKLPAALRKRCPHWPAGMTVRVIQYQIPGFRVSWLLTTLLDAKAHPYDELVGLYHQRWNQETMHREWKQTLNLSNLRSHTAQGVRKEVFVQLTLNNAIRALQAEALPPEGKPLSLRFRDTKRWIVAALSSMAQARVEDLPAIYSSMLKNIAGCAVLVRPGRSYPRPQDGKPRHKGHGKFALPARLNPLPQGTPNCV